MKTKRFFQLNIGWQLIALFFLTVAVLGSYYTIFAMVTKFNWLLSLMILPIAFCFYTFVRLEHNQIVLRKEDIYMPSDWMFWKEKIQFKTQIRYDDIQAINLIRTNKNSLGKNIRRVSPITLLTFLEFKCKDGSNKYLFIFYHTKKQRIKIIDEIKKRMKAIGNDTDMPNTSKIIEDIYTY